MSERVVIIGAVAAGMSAASKIRRLNKEMVIDVYTNEEYISYAACGLPYFIGGVTKELRRLIARTPEQFKEQNIDVHLNHEVIQILPEEKKVRIQSKDQIFEKQYDKLLIATGAGIKKIGMKNSDLDNIFQLRKIPDALKIKEAISEGVKNVVIVGAGYIGIEMVEIFKMLNLKVTMVEAGPQVLSDIDSDMADYVKEYLSENDVVVYVDEIVTGFKGKKKVEKVVTDKKEIDADLVLLALGSEPNSALAEECGILLGKSRAIMTNEHMETNIKDIYAAGDCTSAYHVLYEEHVYIPLGTTANKQGRVAGANIAGAKDIFRGISGTSITKVLDLGISRTGLNSREAEALGYDIIEEVIKGKDIAAYYPIPAPIKIKLTANRKDGRILGAQLLGEGHFAKRIDVIAVAVANGLTAEDLVGVDFAYAPPFSPVWDPYLIAAGKLYQRLATK